MTDPITLMADLAKSGQKVQRIQLGPKRFLFVFDPDAAQDILVKRASIYVQNRTVFDRIRPVTGKRGLVQLSGVPSREARRNARPMFATPSLQAAQTITNRYVDELIGTLRDETDGKTSFDVARSMNDLILKTALEIFLDLRSSDLAEEIGAKFQRLNHLCGERMRSLLPLPLFLPTPGNLEIRSLRRQIREKVAQHLEAMTSSESPTALPNVFRGNPDLIDHCMTFLFAGHETTASSLAFSFLLLAQNPKYQDLIAAGDEEMTLAVYKESLRLFPPAYMLAREAIADDKLAGIRVRKSDQVIIAIRSLHRDEKFFERPDEFYPERFLQKLRHPFAFIPFGAGQKSCIGERLAYVEATTVLKRICEQFRLHTTHQTILADALITLNARPGQHLQIEPRTAEARRNSGNSMRGANVSLA